MKRPIQALILISFLLSKTVSYGQTPDIENYLIPSEELEGSSDLLDIIEEYNTYKFDLNKSAIEELHTNQLITINTIRAIQLKRKRGEQFKSVNEVRNLGLGEEQEKILLSIAGLNIKRQLADGFKFRSRILRKTTEEDFPNEPYKIYTRGSLYYSNGFQLGVLTERDVGEKNIGDHLSFYLTTKNAHGKYDKIIGDYSIEAGQGLLLWQNGFFGRRGDPILSMKKRARGIRPYRSASEINFLRGAAGNWNIRNIDLIAFVSVNKRDASLSDSGDVTNFRQSGLHRTDSELSGKDLVQEKIFGVSGKWVYSDIRIGSRFINVAYDVNVNPIDKPEKVNEFEGRGYNAISVDYDYALNEINFYGEIAESAGGKRSQIHGLKIGHERFSSGLVYRDYDDGFSSVRGAPFGGSDNERGIYAGMKWNINRSSSVSGFSDLYRKKWVTSNSLTPGRSEDYRIEFKHHISKVHSVRIRTWGSDRQLNKKIKDEFSIERKVLTVQKRRNVRIQGKHDLSRSQQVGWRFEKSDVEDIIIDESGLLFSVNAKLQIQKGLSIYIATTRFSTDSYSSRIYLYERDLPGILRNSALFDDGFRFMVLARKEFSPYFSLSLKLEHLTRDNKIGNLVENKIGIQFDLSN